MGERGGGHVRAGVRRLFRLAVRRRELRGVDVDEEVRLHVDLRVEQLVRRGLTESAARARATEWFAGPGHTLEDAARDLRASAARREARMARHEWLADLRRDVRFAGLALLRAPLFTAIAVVTLALGLGATTAIFDVVDGVLLEPLPFREPDRLVGLFHRRAGADAGGAALRQGPATYFTYRDHNRVFEDVGAWNVGRASLTGRGEPERVEALFVTDGTLRLLGVRPALGRLFSREDDAPGAPHRVVLSYGQWRRRFGGAPNVIGQSLEVDGTPSEVIGVLPASFRFLRSDPAVVLPMQLDRSNVWVVFYFQALARLKPGVTLAEANADVARMIPLVTEWVPGYRAWALRPDVRPLAEDVIGDVDRVLWPLAGSVAVVLLIAGANVANLLLVRAEGRRRELAVRAALGASRGRVVRALLAESMLLALAGGAVGLLLAGAAVGLLRRVAPASLPRVEEIGLGATAALFALAAAAATGLVLGLLSALRLDAPNAATLREGGRGASDAPARRRTRDALVVAEVAMALVSLVVAGLMARTLVALRQVQPGFARPEEVQTFRVAVPGALVGDPRQVARLHAELAERLRTVPGVASVGLSSSVTMDGDGNANPTFVEHAPVAAGTLPPHRRFKYLGAGYVETMGNRVVAGRAITWDDVLRPRPVVLVSEALAHEYWRDARDALGKRLANCTPSGPGCPWREIVGVVGDEYDDGPSRPPTPIVYWPLLIEQFGDGPITAKRTMAYAVRSTRVGTAGFVRELQQAVWSVRPDLPLADVRTLDEIQARTMAQTAFATVMLAIAAAVALLLGVVGIYGVIAYAAAQRTREIGIRVALGARTGDVRRLVLRHGLRLAGAGIALGIGASLALTRVVAGLLFGVGAQDPATYAAVSVGLAAVALLAAWLPARRAAGVDPVVSLRADG